MSSIVHILSWYLLYVFCRFVNEVDHVNPHSADCMLRFSICCCFVLTNTVNFNQWTIRKQYFVTVKWLPHIYLLTYLLFCRNSNFRMECCKAVELCFNITGTETVQLERNVDDWKLNAEVVVRLTKEHFTFVLYLFL